MVTNRSLPGKRARMASGGEQGGDHRADQVPAHHQPGLVLGVHPAGEPEREDDQVERDGGEERGPRRADRVHRRGDVQQHEEHRQRDDRDRRAVDAEAAGDQRRPRSRWRTRRRAGRARRPPRRAAAARGPRPPRSAAPPPAAGPPGRRCPPRRSRAAGSAGAPRRTPRCPRPAPAPAPAARAVRWAAAPASARERPEQGGHRGPLQTPTRSSASLTWGSKRKRGRPP